MFWWSDTLHSARETAAGLLLIYLQIPTRLMVKSWKLHENPKDHLCHKMGRVLWKSLSSFSRSPNNVAGIFWQPQVIDRKVRCLEVSVEI